MGNAKGRSSWYRWLPLVGVTTSVVLVGLAVATQVAWQERRDLVNEGRHLRLAHRIEVELREEGPGAATSVLARNLENDALLLALELATANGERVAVVGDPAVSSDLEVEMFLGRQWSGGGGPPATRGRGQRGRRLLRLYADPRESAATWNERLLVPVAVLVGFALTALSFLGRRLLAREEEALRREATRRRLDGLGRAGAGLAHQLRNPLGTLKGSLQLLEERHGQEERVAAALDQVIRMERLISQLLDYARPPRPEPRQVDLEALATELFDGEPRVALTGIAAQRGIRFDPDHLREILVNLVENALATTPGSETVEVSAHLDRQRALVEVADRGPGPGDDPEQLFEPYVSRRPDGVGLGLPISRALAEANGASLVLRPRAGGGTVAALAISGQTQ